MKCNVKNRPMTDDQAKEFQKLVVGSNTSFLSYASRIVYISLRKNFGFGEKRMKRLNRNSVDLTENYISRYTPEGLPQEAAEYAVDSYYGMRIRLRDVHFDPEEEMWDLRPFGAWDFHSPAASSKERERRKMYLHYANTLSFYVREMWCGMALELSRTNQFGKSRLHRLFAEPVQWYKAMIRLYLNGDQAGLAAEKQAVLDEFNQMEIFPKEYNI